MTLLTSVFATTSKISCKADTTFSSTPFTCDGDGDVDGDGDGDGEQV